MAALGASRGDAGESDPTAAELQFTRLAFAPTAGPAAPTATADFGLSLRGAVPEVGDYLGLPGDVHVTVSYRIMLRGAGGNSSAKPSI